MEKEKAEVNLRNFKKTEQEIIDEVAVLMKQIDQLYNGKIINYRGLTKDSGRLFTEVIAEQLLRQDIENRMSDISEVEREKGYRVLSHNGTPTTSIDPANSNRFEEKFALSLFNWSKASKEFQSLGKILDYQVPLKNSSLDKGLGKIDLISLTDNRIYLIELKVEGNKETILRSVLEIATYYQVLAKCKFLSSYADDFKCLTEEDIKKAVLIVKGSSHEMEMEELNAGKRSFLKQLIEKLAVKVFSIDPESNEILKL